MTLEEQIEKAITDQDLTQEQADNIKTYDTQEQHAASGDEWAVVDGMLKYIGSSEGGSGEGGSGEGGEGGSGEGGEGGSEPVPVEFDSETFELAVQPEPDPVIPPKPEPDYYTSGREKASSEKAREEWEEKYGKRYTDTGSKRYVSPRPTLDNNDTFLYESWMFQWGESHDPETGFPLIDEESE